MPKSNLEKIATPSFWSSVGITILIMWYDISTGRFLMHSGTMFAYATLEKQTVPYYEPFARHFHRIFYYLPLKASGLSVLSDTTSVFLNGVAFVTWLFPVLGLIWTYWLLDRYDKKGFAAFVAFSWGASYLSTFPNIGELACDNFVLFWPALTLVSLSPVFTRKCFLGTALILLCWCLSHQVAILGIGAVTFGALLRLRKSETYERRRLLGLLFLCLMSVAYIFYRVLVFKGDSNLFFQEIRYDLGAFRKGTLWILALWVFYFSCSLSRFRIPSWLLFVTTAGVIVYYTTLIFGETSMDSYWTTVLGRTTFMFILTLVGLMAVTVQNFRPDWFLISKQDTTFVIASAALVLLFGAGNELHRSFNWNKNIERVRALLQTGTPCFELENANQAGFRREEFERILPILSILLQESKSVSRILYFREENEKPDAFCCALRNGQVSLKGTGMEIGGGLYFDYSPLLTAAKAQALNCQ